MEETLSDVLHHLKVKGQQATVLVARGRRDGVSLQPKPRLVVAQDTWDPIETRCIQCGGNHDGGEHERGNLRVRQRGVAAVHSARLVGEDDVRRELGRNL